MSSLTIRRRWLISPRLRSHLARQGRGGHRTLHSQIAFQFAAISRFYGWSPSPIFNETDEKICIVKVPPWHRSSLHRHSLAHVFVHLAFPLHFLCSHPVQASNIVLCIENDGPERIKYTVDHGEWSCSLNSEQVQLHGRIPWTSDCKWLNVNEG